MRLRYLIYFGIILSLIFLGIALYNDSLEPAYASYIVSCKPEKIIDSVAKDYETLGQLVISENKTEIKIFAEGELEKEVRKHENCHLKQYESNRIFKCDYGLYYFTELECYLVDELPDPIYKNLYGNY